MRGVQGDGMDVGQRMIGRPLALLRAAGSALWRGWRVLCCACGRHRLFIIGRCAPWADHVGCKDCRRQWGMNHDMRCILPWDEVRSSHIGQGYDDRAAVRAAFQRLKAPGERKDSAAPPRSGGAAS